MSATAAQRIRPEVVFTEVAGWSSRQDARDILLVLHDFELGGGERIAIRLANHWAAAGRRVTLLVGSRQGALTPLVSDEVQVVECDPPIPRGRGSRKRLGKVVHDFIARHRVDLLFVPGNYLWPILPSLARMPESQRPGIVAQIGTPMYRHGRGPIAQLEYNFRTKLRLRQVDAAISLSDAMTRDADKVLGRQITRRLPLPALDDEAAPPVACPPRGRLIVAAGRLVEEKGFDVALRAFAHLNDPEARLAILGEGPCLAKLQALAAELGVEHRVTFPGYVADIGPWLARARAFLLSSFYEGYAAVVVEALAAGRPVVATNCTPAAYELLDRPERGFVAPIGDAEGLARGLRQVLDAAPADPRRIAAAVAHYRIGPIARAYLNIFDAVHLGRGASTVSTRPLLKPSAQIQSQGGRRPVLAFSIDQGDLAG